MSIDGTIGSEARDVAERLTALCEWVPTVASRDIPEQIMRRAATVLCDDIAAIVAARDEPEVKKLQDRMVSRAGARESTVFNGRGAKADRLSAAVANGAAAGPRRRRARARARRRRARGRRGRSRRAARRGAGGARSARRAG